MKCFREEAGIIVCLANQYAEGVTSISLGLPVCRITTLKGLHNFVLIVDRFQRTVRRISFLGWRFADPRLRNTTPSAYADAV